MKNLKIGTRLTIGFVSVLLLMIIMAVISSLQLRRVDHATNSLIEDVISLELAAKDWLANTKLNGERAYVVAIGVDAEDEAEINRKMKETSATISKIQNRLQSQDLDDAEKKMMESIQANRQQYINIRSEALKLRNAGKAEESRKMIRGKMVPAYNAYVENIENFAAYQHTLTEKTSQDITAIYHNGLIIVALLTTSATLLGLFIAWRLTSGITRPLNQAVQVAQTVAGGDLTSRISVNSHDETGLLMQALQDMNESLLKTVSQVRSSAETISVAASEIASGNQDLSSRTEEQASALEQTASSMEELTSTVRQNGDNAQQANQLATSATDIAIRGGEANVRVVETMHQIDASAKKIEEIISVIDSIAFQTNLLALNAAVEAARAGEQGRGFAVVASEVRNLAQRTAQAAGEIKTLIADSVEKVGCGGQLVQQASETMEEIVSSIRQVDDIMREISVASQEQVQGIEQVNQAVSEMDTVSQQNAALVEQAAAAAESLQQQAKTLVHAMSAFKTEADFTNAPAEKTFRITTSKRSKKLPVRLPGYVKHEADMVPALAAARNVSTEMYEEKMEEF